LPQFIEQGRITAQNGAFDQAAGHSVGIGAHSYLLGRPGDNGTVQFGRFIARQCASDGCFFLRRKKVRRKPEQAVELAGVLTTHHFDFVAFEEVETPGFRPLDFPAPNAVVDPTADRAFHLGLLWDIN
jgi:hypothetical protein